MRVPRCRQVPTPGITYRTGVRASSTAHGCSRSARRTCKLEVTKTATMRELRWRTRAARLPLRDLGPGRARQGTWHCHDKFAELYRADATRGARDYARGKGHAVARLVMYPDDRTDALRGGWSPPRARAWCMNVKRSSTPGRHGCPGAASTTTASGRRSTNSSPCSVPGRRAGADAGPG